MSLLSDKFTSRISMRDIANKYGLKVSKSGFTLCPFHQDKHPSMKIYDEMGRGYFCFTCNKGGSVINFTMEYFKIDYISALKKLDNDFGLNVLGEEEDAVVAKDYAARQFVTRRRRRTQTLSLQKLLEDHCRLHNDIKHEPPFSEKFCHALHRIDYLEYLIEHKMNGKGD
jgi:DNA primase